MSFERPPVTVRSLRAVRVRIPFRRPFVTATGMWLHRDAWILRLTDADGREGIGEAVLEPASSEAMGDLAETQLAALIREAAGDAFDERTSTVGASVTRTVAGSAPAIVARHAVRAARRSTPGARNGM